MISFFSSAIRSAKEYTYRMGDFATLSLPLKDSVTLTVQVSGSGVNETITVRFDPSRVPSPYIVIGSLHLPIWLRLQELYQ